MRRCTVTVTAIAVFLFEGAPAFAGQLLVVCKGDQQVAFFDTGTFEQTGSAATGVGGREIVATPDGRWAFVGDFDDIANTVSMIDVGKRALKKKIKIPDVYGPHDLDISRDGKTLYVTCEKSRAVALVDVPSERYAKAFKYSMKGGHTIVLSPDDRWLYIANNWDDNITIMDARTGEVDRHILGGHHDEGIDVSPDGKILWVTSQGTNDITVIDLATKRVATKVKCPGGPIRVKFSPDGKSAYVTCSTGGRVMMFDASTHEVLADIPTGETPFGIEIEPSGGRVYVTNAASNRVSVIDAKQRAVIKDFSTPNIPTGMAYVE